MADVEKTRYFEIDNTPTVGRVNTFICHASGTKGFIHFFNADILPFQIKIPDVSKYGTSFFIVKLFVESSFKGKDPHFAFDKEHDRYNADVSSLEVIPIHVEKRLSTKLIVTHLKETGYVADGGAGEVEKLFKVVHKCLELGIDLSDCCREITEKEYNVIIADIELRRKKEHEEFLKRLRAERNQPDEIRYRKVRKKYYSKEDGLFHISYYNEKTYQSSEETFDSFDAFYKACKGWMFDADLLDYDFDGIDLTKYYLEGAMINSKVAIRAGIYYDGDYKKIQRGAPLSEFQPSESKELVPSRMKYEVVETYPEYEEQDNVFFYISDLHLNHKLLKKFKESANHYEIRRYFTEIVQQLKSTMPHSWNKHVFIVGDVSFNFEFFKMFFKIYKENIYSKTYFVIGNHDLWDRSLCKKCKTYAEMVSEFKKFFESLEIEVLEAELKIPQVKKNSNIKHIYSAEEILNLDDNVIREAFRYNSYGILGGMGFSGLNLEFNCNQGIYRNAPITREFEIKQSKLLSDVHERLKQVIPDKKLIVVTHMPFKDWCSGDPVSNWIYISGHTHKNYYVESDELTMYADNQIGYENGSFGFKFFALKPFFNIFDDYPDGVHEINREDYSIFNYGLGNRSAFNRQFVNLYLLKREKTFLFLMRNKENGPLYILNGGSIKSTLGRDIDYFYDRMTNYAKSVKLFLSKYSEFQKNISREVRRIGGSGTIHGCIVDIDFYNHLYLNPLDGTIVPYFAESMVWKDVYSNVASLLCYKAPHLYKNYLKLIESKSNGLDMALITIDQKLDKKTVFVPETDMYRVSRIIKGLQFTTNFNVIRLWNYAMADEISEESGRLIVSGIINPDSMPEVEDLRKKPKREKTIKVVVPKEPKPVVPKMTYFEKHQTKVKEVTNDTVELLSLPDSQADASLKCKACGHRWYQRIDHFYRVCRCPNCHKMKKYNTVM